jgi:hypothetical protein
MSDRREAGDGPQHPWEADDGGWAEFAAARARFLQLLERQSRSFRAERRLPPDDRRGYARHQVVRGGRTGSS